ncbi:hypothetical protein DFH08DRAFT_960508 [Mycena albidolilacea]|uniref:Uncharacterized protein n=1 Tax=Mycena albidolilacea TaxID=1033008 RepID=A0AAD7A3H4_9AGAR|nr:hypothetical protein DFH08DRAFT_960508 [Mycena albidolilacea]
MVTNLWRNWEIHNARATGDVGTKPLRRAVDEANTSWKISEACATPVARGTPIDDNNTSWTIGNNEMVDSGNDSWTIHNAKCAAPTPADL